MYNVNEENLIVGEGHLSIDGNPMGGTTDGVNSTMTIDQFLKKVDQIRGPLGAVNTDSELIVETNLAEGTLANLKIAWGQTAALEGGGKILPVGVSQNPPEHLIQFTGKDPFGTARVYTFWKAVIQVASAHGLKKDDMTVFPVKFLILVDNTKDEDHCYGTVQDA